MGKKVIHLHFLMEKNKLTKKLFNEEFKLLIDSIDWWNREVKRVFAEADALERKLLAPDLSEKNKNKLLAKMMEIEQELTLLLARSIIENNNMLAFEKKFKKFLS